MTFLGHLHTNEPKLTSLMALVMRKRARVQMDCSLAKPFRTLITFGTGVIILTRSHRISAVLIQSYTVWIDDFSHDNAPILQIFVGIHFTTQHFSGYVQCWGLTTRSSQVQFCAAWFSCFSV